MLTVRSALVCSADKRSGAKIAADFLSESAIDFVANGAENAGRRGALSVAPPFRRDVR
jgi:hypothetical protein